MRKKKLLLGILPGEFRLHADSGYKCLENEKAKIFVLSFLLYYYAGILELQATLQLSQLGTAMYPNTSWQP